MSSSSPTTSPGPTPPTALSPTTATPLFRPWNAAKNGTGRIRLKSAPEQIIGAIGLFDNATNNRGFWLGVPWQRQGLMPEAATAVTDFWFNDLGFPVLRVPKAMANRGSRRISEMTGMRIVAVEEKDYVSGRLPTEIWEITAEEWRLHRRLKS